MQATLVSLLLVAGASAIPAKRQAGPLVYSTGENDQPGAVQPSSTFNTQSLGCWQDNYPYTRVLNGTFFTDQGYVTPETCSTFCASKGYIYSGTESYYECFCGNGLSNSEQIDSSNCNTPCSANQAETCGGQNALSVEKIEYIYPQGCFQDQTNYRNLDGPSTSSGEMTVEICGAFCMNAGYSLAGVEYGTECYCGNTLRLFSADGCNTACAGNSNEVCGGDLVVSVYSVNGVTIQSASATTTSVGCFEDFYPNSRAMSGASLTGDNDNTNELCQKVCTAQGFPYSGTEYSNECYCSMTVPTATSTGCDMPCAGNANEICGGGNALSVSYYGS